MTQKDGDRITRGGLGAAYASDDSEFQATADCGPHGCLDIRLRRWVVYADRCSPAEGSSSAARAIRGARQWLCWNWRWFGGRGLPLWLRRAVNTIFCCHQASCWYVRARSPQQQAQHTNGCPLCSRAKPAAGAYSAAKPMSPKSGVCRCPYYALRMLLCRACALRGSQCAPDSNAPHARSAA